jgi:hypothetical protein
VSAAAASIAACGGDDTPALPTLAGTPIPTLFISPTPTPACGTSSPQPLPAAFAENRVPSIPGWLIDRIETSPHLLVSGIADPIVNPREPDPHVVVAGTMLDNLTDEGWSVSQPQARVTAFEFTHPDGRAGAFSTERTDRACGTRVRLTIEMRWVTGP